MHACYYPGMRRTPLLLLAVVLLCGCGKQTTSLRHPLPVASSSASPAIAERPLEQLPSELSIPYFSTMKLVGSDFTLGKPVSVTKLYSRYNITYRSNGLLITGILNIPSTPGSHPLLVFNHGYIDPKIYTQGRGLKREQDYMANAGFAVLHVDYRGHAGSDPSPMTAKVYDGNLEYAMDSANAIQAIRDAKLPGVDTTKVGMLGHSMGGGVTLAILTGRPNLVDAAVLYAPVNADVWQNFTRWRSKREEGDRTMEAFNTKEENPDFWNALSPATYEKNIRAPILLFQGTDDKDVPGEWSDALAQRLKDLERDVTYVEYEGEGHEFSTQWVDFMKKSAEFFHEHLDEKKS